MRITRVTRAPALLACAAVLTAGAVLAGCGSGSGGSTAGTATAQNQSDEGSIMVIVRCYRTHGDPGFPDPVYDPSDGRWHFGVSPGSAPASTRQACQHLFPSGNPSPPVPQAQFRQLVRLAECIRQHGVPNWPDPDPDGAFGLPRVLQTKSLAFERASVACQRLMPGGGLNVYAAS